MIELPGFGTLKIDACKPPVSYLMIETTLFAHLNMAVRGPEGEKSLSILGHIMYYNHGI